MPKKRFNAEQIVVLLRDGSKLRRIASSIYPDLICDKDSSPTISSVHASTYNTFNVQRYLISAKMHRAFRASAMQTWRGVIAIECWIYRAYHPLT
jgi:hypothetical protein